MYDITAVGEGAVDLTMVGTSQNGNEMFEAIPGGAPCTLLAAAAKLGAKTAQNGVIGNDRFGDMLIRTLQKAGIDTHGIKRSATDPTHVVGVFLDEGGNRSFAGIQTDSTLYKLSAEHLDADLLDNCKILHIAGAMFFREPALSTVASVIRQRRQKNLPLSCDVNWRPGFYGPRHAREKVLPLLKQIDVLKVSEEEWPMLTGHSDPIEGSKALLGGHVKLIVTTLGPRGCFFRNAQGCGFVPTYDTKVINTTGAGDTFFGAMHHRLLMEDAPYGTLSREALTDIVDFANAAGALCAARPGSIGSVPGREEIEQCRATVPKLYID